MAVRRGLEAWWKWRSLLDGDGRVPMYPTHAVFVLESMIHPPQRALKIYNHFSSSGAQSPHHQQGKLHILSPTLHPPPSTPPPQKSNHHHSISLRVKNYALAERRRQRRSHYLEQACLSNPVPKHQRIQRI